MGNVDTEALAIVEAALDREEGVRDAFVRERCGDDAALRARVEQLLGAEADDFRLLATEHFSAAQVVPLPLPDRIGPFRIVEVIGDGGMGTVAKATRDDGVFDQTVAIKLIRAGLSDRRARERFEEERRILGRLDHPGIARILDGGEADGRPWLAMDFVEGAPITRALDAAGATLDARIAAFLLVADAVAHAHRNLVIHADIKPGNVLMTAAGQARLLDFGIARLVVDLDQDESGTPYPLTRAYAAPERAVGATPTIAGDVYALGVLLHEILTGRLPESGRAMGVNGDLDAIVARALADDPAERYPDVGALIAEIEAWRNDLPVAARTDAGWRYHAAKFLRRHRTGVIATAAAGALLIATAVTSTTLYIRAETARAEADRRFNDVRAMARFMLFDLYDDLADSPGTVGSRARLAETAGRYLARLERVPDAPLDLQLDTARGWRRLASVQGMSGVASLGDTAAAKASLERAEAGAEATLAADPGNAGALDELGWLTTMQWALADTSDGSAISARAMARFDAALRADPANASARLGRVAVRKNQAFDLIAANRPAQALPILKAAIADLRTMRFSGTLARDARALEVNLLGRLGDAVYYAGDVPGALPWYREQDAIVRAELARKRSMVWTEKLGETKFNLSGTLAETGRNAEALREADAGIAALQAALEFGPDDSLEKRLLILYNQQGLIFSGLGRTREAVAASARGMELRETRLAAAPGDLIRKRDLAVPMANHAKLLAEAGDRTAACTTARRGVALFDDLKKRDGIGKRDIEREIPLIVAAQKAYC